MGKRLPIGGSAMIFELSVVQLAALEMMMRSVDGNNKDNRDHVTLISFLWMLLVESNVV